MMGKTEKGPVEQSRKEDGRKPSTTYRVGKKLVGTRPAGRQPKEGQLAINILGNVQN